MMNDKWWWMMSKKCSANWLKLCTPTCYDELFFLYLGICAKQICCGFTGCRLARGVPTCQRGANFSRKAASLARPFSWLWATSLPTSLPTDLPIKKVSLILLKLCTPTGHELIFLYFWISAKQICCGFTECRLARGVPTCPWGANFSRLFLIMSEWPPDLPPDRPQKGCLILLELGTLTGHDELLILYFRNSARQECFEFTECRLKGTVFFFRGKDGWSFIHSKSEMLFFFPRSGKKKQTLRKRWKAIFS